MTAVWFWATFGGLFLAVAIADRTPRRPHVPADSVEALNAIDLDDTWLEEIEREDQERARHGDSWAFGTRCAPALTER